MRKTLLASIFAISAGLGSSIWAQVLGINTWSQGLCINSKAYAAVTTSATGATSYSWSVISGSCSGTQTPGINGFSTFITYPCCGNYTISCTAYNGASPLTTVSQTVSVACNAATNLLLFSSAPNGTICSGSTMTLSGAGGITYTWIPGNMTGANVVVAPTSNTCYSLVANNALGCFNMSVPYCTSVVPVYPLSISGNTTVCLGQSTTFTFTGGPSYITNPGNINSANPIITPSVSSMYTISTPSPTYACPTNSVIVVLVNPTPTLSIISSGATSLCAGSSRTLIAGGNATTYSWSTGATTQSIVVSPLANTCYNCTGSNMQNCMFLANYCFTVLPLPSLTVSGSNTVCLGSSTTFSVGGANTYTWGTFSSTGSTINILPTSSSTVSYNVYGTSSLGCTSFTPFSLTTLSTCAIVWPGDANSDGIVNGNDVLELGLQFSSTGTTRSPGGNSYTGQFVSIWVGTGSTGKNKCHADCNGDGIVNNADTNAIVANFALTHAFRPAGAGTNSDISIVPDQNVVYPGQWNKANIILGSSGNTISNLYGLIFELGIDQTYLELNTSYLVYTPSFLNATNQNIEFRKAQLTNNKIFAASVRTDQNNVNGTGKIAELWFKVKADAPDNSVINLSVNNSEKINNLGASASLSGGTAAALVSTNLVGIRDLRSLENSVHFFPNPAKDKVILQSDVSGNVSYAINDVFGRKILAGSFSVSQTIDISTLTNGTYFLRFEFASGNKVAKLVIER